MFEEKQILLAFTCTFPVNVESCNSRGSLTRVDKHVLLEILYSSEADATCRALEGPFRTVESWAVGGTDVQVIWVLDIL